MTYALPGNSPLVIDKESDAIEPLGSAEGLNVRLDALEDRRPGHERADTISIRDQTDRAGWSLQLRVRGGPVGRPATRIEVPSRRRIRVVVGNQPALWAEIDDDHYGYRWMRAERVRSVIPSLRVEDIRAHGDAQSSGWLARWSRTFVRMLSESDASPLYPGAWDLRALTTAFDGYFARDARAMLEQSARDAEDGYTEWDFGDRPPPLLLRVPSAADHGRVKAWRKIARGGQLPPLLLWWVSGLDRHLVLDGADRLVAATLEGVTPAALSLSGVRLVPTSRTKDRELAEWAEQSGRFTNDQLNAFAMKGFDDPVRRESITRAWPATDAAWPLELR